MFDTQTVSPAPKNNIGAPKINWCVSALASLTLNVLFTYPNPHLLHKHFDNQQTKLQLDVVQDQTLLTNNQPNKPNKHDQSAVILAPVGHMQLLQDT